MPENCNPDALAQAAKCFVCTPPTTLLQMQTYLLCQILNNGGTGGGGATTFLQLTDTPASYAGAAGQVVTVNPGETGLIFTAAAGTGTVTNFTAGNLSPLFTTSVATSNTTPALTFAAVNQAANLFYVGPATGAAAAPTFRAMVTADLGTTLTPQFARVGIGIAADPVNPWTVSTLAVLRSDGFLTTGSGFGITGVADGVSGTITGADTVQVNGGVITSIVSGGFTVGTVTSFSAGGLSPLFTTNVATATTTPALTFALVNQAANIVYAGPASGAAAAPTFRALVALDIPSLSTVYVPVGRTITIAGTANQVISSAGAQDLSANRTWTLSTPQDIATTSTPRFLRMGLGAAASADDALLIVQGSVSGSDSNAINNTVTWNDSGQQFIAVLLNVTDSASDSGSLFLNCRLNAVSRFSVNKTGLTTITNTALGTTVTDGLLLQNTTAAAAGAQQYSPTTHWTGQGWKTNATAGSQSVDCRAYVVPVQGAANPTGTWTLDMSINGAAYTTMLTVNSVGTLTSTGFVIGTGAIFTSTLQALNLVSTGNVTAAATGQINWTGRSVMTSAADGQITLSNAAVTDFTRLNFGGVTSSFPCLKRSATILQARLADDSAYSPIEGSTLRTAIAFTVATLPAAGTAGRIAYVTDALAPTFLAVIVGGGAVVSLVFDNGTNWVAA